MLNLDNLSAKIKKTADSYWPDFQLVAFAFYTREKVYMYNHPSFPPMDEVHSFERTEHFTGADSLILYEDYPTAIINLERYTKAEDLYSIVLHELFHGFQYLKKDERFPNEILGMTYPLVEQNVELRNKERYFLYKALTSTSQKEKVNHLRKFIHYRENRRPYIDPYLDYELAIETIEGPAFYVEYQAYKSFTNKSVDEVVKKYGRDLLEARDSQLHLRRSCYSSGLFICLLLDEISTNWKNSFFHSDYLLYDFLKGKVNWEFRPIATVEISDETLSIMEEIRKNKAEAFRQFEVQKGYHLFITGEFKRKYFDPMNVIVEGNKQLHKNFLTILINGIKYHLNQPSIIYYNETNHTINKLHLVLEEKPMVHDGWIIIEDLGKIQAKLTEKDGDFYINL